MQKLFDDEPANLIFEFLIANPFEMIIRKLRRFYKETIIQLNSKYSVCKLEYLPNSRVSTVKYNTKEKRTVHDFRNIQEPKSWQEPIEFELEFVYDSFARELHIHSQEEFRRFGTYKIWFENGEFIKFEPCGDLNFYFLYTPKLLPISLIEEIDELLNEKPSVGVAVSINNFLDNHEFIRKVNYGESFCTNSECDFCLVIQSRKAQNIDKPNLLDLCYNIPRDDEKSRISVYIGDTILEAYSILELTTILYPDDLRIYEEDVSLDGCRSSDSHFFFIKLEEV